MCLNSDISAGIYTLVVVIKEKVLSGIKEKVDSYQMIIDYFYTLKSPQVTCCNVTREKKRFILSQLIERFLYYKYGDTVHLKRLK